MDTCINGEVEALVDGFGSDGYSAFSNRASPLNSDGNNAHFGVYNRILADQQKFDFQAGLWKAINQAWIAKALCGAMANASYGYGFGFFKNALALKPSVGVIHNHLGSTNFESNSAQKRL